MLSRIYLMAVLQKPASGSLGLRKNWLLFHLTEAIQWEVSSNQALTAIQFNIARICPIGQRMNVAGKRKQEGSPQVSLGKLARQYLAIPAGIMNELKKLSL